MTSAQKRYGLWAVLTAVATVTYFLTSKNGLAKVTYFEKFTKMRSRVLDYYTYKINSLSAVDCQSFDPPPFPLPALRSEFGTTFWRCIFPDLGDLLNTIERKEISWPVNTLEATDPKKTTIELERTIYGVGDTVTGFIQTRTFTGKDKSYGGDHFRARLVGLGSDDVAPCIVTYKTNGRYLLQTVVPWPGKSVLIVELVHSSESLVQMVKALSTYVHPTRVSQLKPLETEGMQALECDVGLRNRSSGLSVCHYSDKVKGITWICSKYDNSSCPKKFVYLISKRIVPKIRKLDFPVEIQNSGKLTITSKAVSPFENSTPGECWPISSIATKSKATMPTGYYSNTKWVSLACNRTVKELTYAKQCLKGKTVYLLGDSTMRQWFISLTRALGLKDVHLPLAKSWSMPRRGVDVSGLTNTSLYYFCHAPPLFNPGPPESRPSLVDTLGGIRTRDAIIVFNLGAHFMDYDPVVFLQRVLSVRAAVLGLQRRAPDAVILLRGAIRFTKDRHSLDEWAYLRTDLILRHVFAKLPFVRVIDTWEVTTCKPQLGVHPSEAMIDDLLTLFLSFVC